jgi:hypothetical protein
MSDRSPPSHLTTSQREIWNRIIGSVPAGHIKPSQLGLLAHYCMLEDMGRGFNLAGTSARRELRQNAHEMVSIARALRLTNRESDDGGS